MTKSHEHARLLLAKAAEHEWMLHRTVDAPDAPVAALGFHAQQAVEKHLKAVLTVRAIDYPRTHDLALLLDRIQHQGLEAPPDAVNLPKLTPFAVGFRYDAPPEPESAGPALDRVWLRECVRRTRAWAEGLATPSAE